MNKVMMTTAGLWIDHRKAVIVIVSDKGEEALEIKSNVEQQLSMAGKVAEIERHGQLHQQSVARFLEQTPLALIFKVDNPRGEKSAPHTATAR
jgi:hypothetical protein